MKNRNRSISPPDLPEPTQILVAARKIMELADARPGLKAILLVPVKGNITGGVFAEAFGDAPVRALYKGEGVRLGQGHLHLATPLATKWIPNDVTVGLVVYPTKKTLDMVETAPKIEEIIVAAGIGEEFENWRAVNKPAVIGVPQAVQPQGVLDPLLVKALERVDGMVNKSGGIDRAPYMQWSMQILRHVHQKGAKLEPGKMRAWAMARGWSAQAADDLESFAEVVLAGRRKTGENDNGRLRLDDL